MCRWLICTIISAAACCAAREGEGSRIFEQVRQTVVGQVARTGNYTCVQTIDRTYYDGPEMLYQRPQGAFLGCNGDLRMGSNREVMHDRLRLDVAVSEGQEIFSWHGGRNFSSGDISDVIPSGPISSGSFVGYLRNIFLTAGVAVTYRGPDEENGTRIEKFEYSVPLESSHQVLQGLHRQRHVGFHGSFAADARSYELVSLSVRLDPHVDSDSSICSAEIDMNYGMASISGKESLIPRQFTLRIVDAAHTYTVSRSDYAQCREFRGQSTLRFDADESKGGSQAALDEEGWPLPGGLRLQIRLRTPIDSGTAFTGDAVEGVLQSAVKLHNGIQIGRGASLTGVITLLEEHDRPQTYYLLSIEFDELTSEGKRFRLKATPEVSRQEINKLGYIFGRRLPPRVALQSEKGVFVETVKPLHLDERFSAEWKTLRVPAKNERGDRDAAR
jgi:hypothetical protein